MLQMSILYYFAKIKINNNNYLTVYQIFIYIKQYWELRKKERET